MKPKKSKKTKKTDWEKQNPEKCILWVDPDFQEWYLSLTLGFLLEEMEFDEMIDEIYADLSVSEGKERGGNKALGKVTVVKPPLSQCR